MKKILTLIISIAVLNLQISASNELYAVWVGSVEAKRINTLGYFKNLSLSVGVIVSADSPNKDAMMLIFADSYNTTYRLILVNDKNYDTFKSGLKKYLEWEAIATREKISIEKEIMIMSAYPEWQWGGDWYTGSGYSSMSLRILSQNTTRHQLVLGFTEVESKQNQFIDFEPGYIYLDKEEVQELLNLLDPTVIKRKIDEAQAEQLRKNELFK
ncbi:hypothetical protein PVA44_06245 [Entomospira nematocerorum]|uniref:Uncharacterized protein n=1 Tax=Entomospira nematocerorum TaxID=2719987 RepID=A0A968GAS7_9SPIO|nr:hypothetical protein [Entomospira nematocera]NIZ46379.1 hypothetical protein [Entomospira nematocera]WDI33817.1 hypothetical protein PVA44_06245 [Entomospira nematocera]